MSSIQPSRRRGLIQQRQLGTVVLLCSCRASRHHRPSPCRNQSPTLLRPRSRPLYQLNPHSSLRSGLSHSHRLSRCHSNHRRLSRRHIPLARTRPQPRNPTHNPTIRVDRLVRPQHSRAAACSTVVATLPSILSLVLLWKNYSDEMARLCPWWSTNAFKR